MIRKWRWFLLPLLALFVLLAWLVWPKDTVPTSGTLAEYKTYFTELAREKGAKHAFVTLRMADFPFGIDTHAIGHEIGYVLYEQEGGAGIGTCSDAFRGAACAHAIVIQEYIHEGASALERLSLTCAEKPEGSFERSDCFHGIGHGILAYADYNYESAIGECTTASEIVLAHNADTNGAALRRECVDGVTMEMMQGFHDPEAWEKMRATYLPESDLFMPCSASFMPEELNQTCYLFIRSRIFKHLGRVKGDAQVHPELYTKALSYCEQLPDTDIASSRACYAGFGVDFVYLVTGNDDRSFPKMSDTQLNTVHELCSFAPTLDGRSACTLTAVDMVLSRGEGTRAAARFCSLTPDPVLKERCYTTLISLSERYSPSEHLCGYLPEPYATTCREAPDDE